MIYLGAPYNHPDKDVIQERMEKIYKKMSEMISVGVNVLTPLAMHEVAIRYELDGSFEFWREYCLDLLKRCDMLCVLKLEDWDKSVGLKAEIDFCEEHGIPVVYINDNEIFDEKTYFNILLVSDLKKNYKNFDKVSTSVKKGELNIIVAKNETI